jgi:1,2-diacylglycerol 3-beta-glucosyltransferase
MIADIVGLTVMLYAFCYLMFALVIAIGEKRHRPRELPDELPHVSVVLCVRNEEANLPRCLDSLMSVDYPRDRIEVMIVDDESGDGSRRIIEDYAARDAMFRVLSTEFEPTVLCGKQRPLAMGIREATGEIIMVTDADVAVEPGWVNGHIRAYGDDTGIVGGATRADISSGRIFHKLQNCELITLHAVAMGCAGLGLPLSVMGNNLSFRTQAYRAVGGYEALDATVVEDMALMNAIVTGTPFKHSWATDPGAVVTTLPESDFAAFITQRLRWMSGFGELSLMGKAMMGGEALMVLSFIAALVVAPWNPRAVIGVAAAWCEGYGLMIVCSQGYRRSDVFWIPVTLLFQVVYGAVLVVRRLFGAKRIVWKGRVYDGA